MKTKGSKCLTYTQKLQIETLVSAKMKPKEIANNLGIKIRRLYYELKRGAYQHLIGATWEEETRYSAYISHENYKQKCLNKGRLEKIGNDYEFVNYINNRCKSEHITACAVLGEIKHKKMPFKTQISKTTLYRYIKLGYFDNVKLMERKTKYKRQVIKRVSKGTSIERRPVEINSRNTFGHWEMDCVCGSTKATFLVLSERLTRKEFIFKMENQKADSVIKCLNSLEYRFGRKFKQVFKSITMDNGSEFQNHIGIEKSIYGKGKRTTTYYCHPYCSCERGTNERLNREIRRLVPKGTDLSKYSANDVKHIEDWLNNYPKSIFNYASANERFDEQLLLIA